MLLIESKQNCAGISAVEVKTFSFKILICISFQLALVPCCSLQPWNGFVSKTYQGFWGEKRRATETWIYGNTFRTTAEKFYFAHILIQGGNPFIMVLDSIEGTHSSAVNKIRFQLRLYTLTFFYLTGFSMKKALFFNKKIVIILDRLQILPSIWASRT